jgi:hypothetical protein
VTLNGISSLNNNAASYRGGGVENRSGLTLNDSSTVTSNRATGSLATGGGIYNEGGAVTLNNNSAISGNSATVNGGGVYNNGGTLNNALPSVNVYNNSPDDIYPPPT